MAFGGFVIISRNVDGIASSNEEVRRSGVVKAICMKRGDSINLNINGRIVCIA